MRNQELEDCKTHRRNTVFQVHTIAADINDKEKLIRELTKLNVGITGIIHSAGVLKDSKIERQNKESFNQVFTPKANGFHVLEEIEKHFNYKVGFNV